MNYKVIGVTDWWSTQSLAKKIEKELNILSKEDWELHNIELGYYGYNAIITLVKT